MKRPILVLCIDRDNDLYEKAGVSGPLIGREKNLEGAIALSLADPEDPDSNTIFCAIKTYDQMRKEGLEVELATLTGDKALSFKADRSIGAQLEKIIAEWNPASCVLISDGPSDEEILPVIKSRLKVDSTRIVFIKQAKELEKTYFVLLEKLRDPYFARIIIGIPAVLILLFSLSSLLGLGWQPVGVIIGAYLLLRLMGVEDLILGVLKDLRFSFERTGWVGYVGALAIFSIGIFVGYQTLKRSIGLGLSEEKIIFSVIGSTVWIFFVGLLMILIGKSMDAIMDRKKYEVTKYLLYSAAAGLATIVLVVSSLWIVNLSKPYVDFGMFLATVAGSLMLGYLITQFIEQYRKDILIGMKLEGKEVISEHGTYLGKIVGFDTKRNNLIILSMFDKRMLAPVSAISSVEEKVILKSTE